MYTWGYLKEASLAKLDMSADQAIEMGLLNKFPFYANEAITQVMGVKPRRTFAEFDVKNERDIIEYCKLNWKLDDVSFITRGVQDEEDLTANQAKALHYYRQFVFVNKEVRMPEDFFSWNDDRSYIEKYGVICQASENDYNLYGANHVLFFKPAKYRIPYNAKWFKFAVSMNDDVVIDVPDDIAESIPSYIVAQCYKIDDESKAAVYRNEFEMFLARLDENDVHVNRAMKITGEW